MFSLIFGLENDDKWYLQFIKENIMKLLKPEKIFYTYIKHLEKCELYAHKEKTICFKEFLDKFTAEKICEMLFQSFISKDVSNFNYFQAKNFANYINENFKIGIYFFVK